MGIRKKLNILIALREALSEQLTKKEHKKFVLEEASDYEVVHLVATGKFPKAIADLKEEWRVFDEIRLYVLENFGKFCEKAGVEAAEEFVLEFDPVSQLGLSSSKKFLAESYLIDENGKIVSEDVLREVVNVVENLEEGAAGKLIRAPLKLIKGAKKPAATKAAATQKLRNALADIGQRISNGKKALAQLAQRIKTSSGTAKESLKAQHKKQAEQLKKLRAKQAQLKAELIKTRARKIALGAGAAAGVAGAYAYTKKKK